MGRLYVGTGVGATLTDGDNVVERSHLRVVVTQEGVNKLEAELADVVILLEYFQICELFHLTSSYLCSTAMILGSRDFGMIPTKLTRGFPF